MAAAINKTTSRCLIEELDYWMNHLDHEEACDIADAFVEVESLATDTNDRPMIAACRRVLIDAGYYQPMSDEVIARCVVSRGKAWDFSMSGVKYECVSGLTEWAEA